MPKQRIRKFTVTITDDAKKRDHAESLLRIFSRGDIAGYITECQRECTADTTSR